MTDAMRNFINNGQNIKFRIFSLCYKNKPYSICINYSKHKNFHKYNAQQRQLKIKNILIFNAKATCTA